MVGPSRTTMRRAGIRACGAHPRAPGSVIQKSWTTLRSPTNQFDRCQLRRTGQNFFLAFLFHDESFSHPCGLATRPTVREFEKEISKRKKKKKKRKRWSISRSRLVSFDDESIDPRAKQEIGRASYRILLVRGRNSASTTEFQQVIFHPVPQDQPKLRKYVSRRARILSSSKRGENDVLRSLTTE